MKISVLFEPRRVAALGILLAGAGIFLLGLQAIFIEMRVRAFIACAEEYSNSKVATVFCASATYPEAIQYDAGQ